MAQAVSSCQHAPIVLVHATEPRLLARQRATAEDGLQVHPAALQQKTPTAQTVMRVQHAKAISRDACVAANRAPESC